MPKRDLYDTLSEFFDDAPDVVRAEISSLLIVLGSDGTIDTESVVDQEQVARSLFDAQTQFGRMGNLIGAAGVIDVYFAVDPQNRFAAMLKRSERSHDEPGADRLAFVRERYADRLAAIERARRDWMELRRTILAPAAIGEALMPVAPASAS
jgi:hypothetical protein